MTRPLEVEGTPRAHLKVPAHWPYGELANDHPAARYAQAFSAALREALGSKSYRWLARESGVSHGTISAVIRGDTWPDLLTISKIEWAMGKPLWPGPMLFAEQLQRLRMVQAEYLRVIARRARPPL